MITRDRFIKRKMLLGGFVSLLVLIGFYVHTRWPQSVKNAAAYIAYPVLLIQYKCVAPLKAWFEHRKTVQELAVALKAAQDEKEQLLSKVIELQSAQDFSSDNKEIIDFKQRYICSQAIFTQILIKNISEQAHYCMLDAGAQKGIKKNMVAVYKNTVVGKVVEVYPYYSKLLLLTDSRCKIAAYCSESKAAGIHGGMNNPGATMLMHVSHLAQVQEGDLVLSSGDGLIFPRGFALGRVVSAVTNGLLCDITVQPLIDIRTIQYCYVVQKGNEVVSLLDDAPKPLLQDPHGARYAEQFAPQLK